MSNYFVIKAGRKKTADLVYDAAPGAEILDETRLLLEYDPNRLIYLDTVAGNDANDGLTPATPKLTYAAAVAALGGSRTTIQVQNDGAVLNEHITAPTQVKKGAIATIPRKAPNTLGALTPISAFTARQVILYDSLRMALYAFATGSVAGSVSYDNGVTWTAINTGGFTRWPKFFHESGVFVAAGFSPYGTFAFPGAEYKQLQYCDFQTPVATYEITNIDPLTTWYSTDVTFANGRYYLSCSNGRILKSKSVNIADGFNEYYIDPSVSEKIFFTQIDYSYIENRIYAVGIRRTAPNNYDIILLSFDCDTNAITTSVVTSVVTSAPPYCSLCALPEAVKYGPGANDEATVFVAYFLPASNTQAPFVAKDGAVRYLYPQIAGNDLFGRCWYSSYFNRVVFARSTTAAAQAHLVVVDIQPTLTYAITKYTGLADALTVSETPDNFVISSNAGNPQTRAFDWTITTPSIRNSISGFRVFAPAAFDTITTPRTIASCTAHNLLLRAAGALPYAVTIQRVKADKIITDLRRTLVILSNDARVITSRVAPIAAPDTIDIMRNSGECFSIVQSAATGLIRLRDNIVTIITYARFLTSADSGNYQNVRINIQLSAACYTQDPKFISRLDRRLQRVVDGYLADSPMVGKSLYFSFPGGGKADLGAWSAYETNIEYRYNRAFRFLKPSKEQVKHVKHNRADLHVSIDGTPDVAIDPAGRWEELVLSYRALPNAERHNVQNHIAFVDFMESLIDSTVSIDFDPNYTPALTVTTAAAHVAGDVVLNLNVSSLREGDVIVIDGVQYFVLYTPSNTRAVLDKPLHIGLASGVTLQVLSTSTYGDWVFIPQSERSLSRWYESATDWLSGLTLRFVRRWQQ